MTGNKWKRTCIRSRSFSACAIRIVHQAHRHSAERRQDRDRQSADVNGRPGAHCRVSCGSDGECIGALRRHPKRSPYQVFSRLLQWIYEQFPNPSNCASFSEGDRALRPRCDISHFRESTVMRLSGSDPLPDVDAASQLVKYFADGRKLASPNPRWGIQLKGNSTLIGTCGFFAWNRGWKKCSVGYELDPAWQKKGLMLEALTTILTWGFHAMSLHRVEAQIHPENFASIKLMNSLGFTQEGTLREAAHWGGQVHDMLQLGLLRNELQPAQPEQS